MQSTLRDGGRGLPSFGSIQERLEIYFKRSPAVLGQTGKAERLQPSLRRPHRKQRLGLLPDGSGPKVKHEIHGDFLVERTLQMQHPTGSRELMQFSAHLPAIG